MRSRERVPIEIIEVLKEGIIYTPINTLGADFFQIGLLKELKEVPGEPLAPHLP
jgi:hypothetical protein